jgi:NAD(P)-dependent dehydrogenase (short-subunit alcohol dehydrogenase family)
MVQRRPSPSLLRVALVTGANRGIGFEVCRQLAGKDFVVLLTARDLAKAKAAADKLKSAGVIEPVVLDVGDASSIKHAAAEVERRYGRLDVLINNAGINYDTWESAEKADIDGTVMETVRQTFWGHGAHVRHSYRCCERAERAES